MTIDEMIAMLLSAKEEIGGDKAVYVAFDGNTQIINVLQIEDTDYSCTWPEKWVQIRLDIGDMECVFSRLIQKEKGGKRPGRKIKET